MIVLRDAVDRSVYGGKAAGLAEALRAGLPVPDGRALGWREALALPTGVLDALADLGPVAVRSSAVDEDGAGASFAGQHRTHVHVVGAEAIREAIADVEASARSASAMAYRKKLGLTGEPRMAIVVQRVIDADSAGVLFTRHPVTGADERVVEAAWGLGETVVAGLVTPDVYRWARGGKATAQVGDKEVAIRPAASGGTEEVAVAVDRVRARVLDDAQLGKLDVLAASCERMVGAAVDLEWAFAGGALYLLQCRRVTR